MRFSVSPSVMPGLDPGIHAIPVSARLQRRSVSRDQGMDRRVKPGDDIGEQAVQCSPAYNFLIATFLFLPTASGFTSGSPNSGALISKMSPRWVEMPDATESVAVPNV